jgi:two-component system cell cycle response regulator
MIETQPGRSDPLRLCSQLRSREATRFIPLLLICGEGEDKLITRALDLGVDDCVIKPLDRNELVARCSTQIKRKRYNDRLRESVHESITFSVTDPLTGLFNRRYLDSHIGKLAARSRDRTSPLSLLVIDIDYFKSINDTYGHDAGDRVLAEFSRRMRGAVRNADLVCRVGGEEFVIVLPNTGLKESGLVAERLRACVAREPYAIEDRADPLQITASIGLAMLRKDEQVSDLIKRADTALLEAKSAGRDRVKVEAA